MIFVQLKAFFELHSSAMEREKDKKWAKINNFLANCKSLNEFIFRSRNNPFQITIFLAIRFSPASRKNEIFCAGRQLSLLSWSNGDTSATANNLVAGTYSVIVTDSNGCTATESFTITEPVAIDNSVIQDEGILTANENSASYQWYECPNTLISGATNQSFTPTAIGDYKVEITVGGCTVVSDCVTVSTLNTSTFENKTELLIYPNPSNGIFTIKSTENIEVSVFDMLGKLIMTRKLGLESSIDLSQYRDGVYILRIINSDKKEQTYKLIKKSN